VIEKRSTICLIQALCSAGELSSREVVSGLIPRLRAGAFAGAGQGTIFWDFRGTLTLPWSPQVLAMVLSLLSWVLSAGASAELSQWRRRRGVDHRQLVEQLLRVPVEELVAVLRDVFDARQPWPEEAAYYRNRFFLGIASSELVSDEGEPERWGPWELDAVAYPDPAHYGGSPRPDWGLCQSGTCVGCGAGARSNVKNGVCAICGTAVYVT
jgi:hypothetical protein